MDFDRNRERESEQKDESGGLPSDNCNLTRRFLGAKAVEPTTLRAGGFKDNFV
jgi:hypothetical protein